MGVATTLLVAIAGSVIAILLATELQSWVPWLEQRLIKRAISRMPEELRERYSEEWAAHLSDMPTAWSRLFVALQLCSAGKAIAKESMQATGHRPLALEPMLRRVFDLSAAICLLLCLTPMLLLTGLAIKLESPGPLFVRSARVTSQGETWYVLKFRTKSRDGSKLTAVGLWLRQLSIDEIPQLLDVIRGDMALIGGKRYIAKDARSLLQALKSAVLPVRHCHPGAIIEDGEGTWDCEGKSEKPKDRDKDEH